ncbi:TPA: conjugal transfer protein [Streptococcus pyogenes]|nr:conjugal transfer protein [Streptococcus pyogenes]
MEEELFDYGRCINAPYWVQELKTPKGTRIWVFSTPMQVSFFVMLVLTFVLTLQVLGPVIHWLNTYTHHIFLPLYVAIPWKVSKWYVETEPQGKKVHQYIYDWIVYTLDYELDKRAIYQEERLAEEEELFVFEKTNL